MWFSHLYYPFQFIQFPPQISKISFALSQLPLANPSISICSSLYPLFIESWFWACIDKLLVFRGKLLGMKLVRSWFGEIGFKNIIVIIYIIDRRSQFKCTSSKSPWYASWNCLLPPNGIINIANSNCRLPCFLSMLKLTW